MSRRLQWLHPTLATSPSFPPPSLSFSRWQSCFCISTTLHVIVCRFNACPFPFDAACPFPLTPREQCVALCLSFACVTLVPWPDSTAFHLFFASEFCRIAWYGIFFSFLSASPIEAPHPVSSACHGGRALPPSHASHLPLPPSHPLPQGRIAYSFIINVSASAVRCVLVFSISFPSLSTTIQKYYFKYYTL